MVGFFLIVTVAYLSTRWNRRSELSAKRGAFTGALTVFGCAVLGTLICMIPAGGDLSLLLFAVFCASLAFIPLGAIIGALIYRS